MGHTPADIAAALFIVTVILNLVNATLIMVLIIRYLDSFNSNRHAKKYIAWFGPERFSLNNFAQYHGLQSNDADVLLDQLSYSGPPRKYKSLDALGDEKGYTKFQAAPRTAANGFNPRQWYFGLERRVEEGEPRKHWWQFWRKKATE